MGPFDFFFVHTLRVHAKTSVKGPGGAPTWTTLPPVEVKGMMRGINSKESGSTGLSIFNTFAFATSEPWKFDAVTHVEWLDELRFDGKPRVFEQHGSSVPSNFGMPTDHTKVYFVERGAK